MTDSPRGAWLHKPNPSNLLWRVPGSPPWSVERCFEETKLRQMMLDASTNKDRSTVIILEGPGGYGKTTLAQNVCNSQEIRRAFTCCIWLELGRNPQDLLGLLSDEIHALDLNERNFNSIPAASAAFSEIIGQYETLLVIDDVWQAVHVEPFILRGGWRCLLLITRDAGLFSREEKILDVGQMNVEEAVQVLVPKNSVVGIETRRELHALAERLARWPLLLRLVAGRIGSLLRASYDLPAALNHVSSALILGGPIAFDDDLPQRRDQAVTVTLATCLEAVSDEWKERFRQLGVFPEGAEIPLHILSKLWNAVHPDVERFCSRLRDLFLIEKFNGLSGTIQLHGVIAGVLATQLPSDQDRQLHQRVLAQFASSWWTVPAEETYFWDHFVFHLHGAERQEDLLRVAKSVRFQSRKCRFRGAGALESDLRFILRYQNDDPLLEKATRIIANSAHLLQECDSLQEVRGVLMSRLAPEMDETWDLVSDEEAEGLALVPFAPLPDGPSPELIRTLSGHEDRVYGCAFGPDGDFVVSASADSSIRIWNTGDGFSRPVKGKHEGRVFGVCVSRDGKLIASASEDHTVRIWERITGELKSVLRGHEGAVWACDFSPDGERLASVSEDGTLRSWRLNGVAELVLKTPESVGMTGCSFSPDGQLIATAGSDGRLALWDLSKFERIPYIIGSHKAAAWHCTISGDGLFLVSTGVDCDVIVWSLTNRQVRARLVGHDGPVWGCDTNRDCSRVISASEDLTLRWWDVDSGVAIRKFEGHKRYVWSCALSEPKQTVVSASLDSTLKLWSVKENA